MNLSLGLGCGTRSLPLHRFQQVYVSVPHHVTAFESWTRLAQSLKGTFTFVLGLQLVDDDHFLHRVGRVCRDRSYVPLNNIQMGKKKVWRTHSTHQRGSGCLTLCLVVWNLWMEDTGTPTAIKAPPCVIMQAGKSQRSQFDNIKVLFHTLNVCSRSCTLSTFYSRTPEQYLIMTTVMRCSHWALHSGSPLLAYYLNSVAEKSNSQAALKAITFLNYSHFHFLNVPHGLLWRILAPEMTPKIIKT